MSAIIIPSKNIYKIDNQKVVKNKINKINYEYDNVVPTSKKQSYSYDIYDEEKKINPYIETITNNNNPNGKQTFAKVRIVFEDFGLEDIRLSLEYPRRERIRTDENGNIVYDETTKKPAIDFGKTFRYDDEVYSAEIDSPLVNNDSRLNTDDAWFWNFIIYKEYESRSKVSYICYFNIGDGYGKGWYSTAIIHADYNCYNRENVSVDNNGQFALPKNEWMQYQTIAQSSDGNFHIYEYHSSKIISQYKNGKETATVLCSISDYYDENGEKVISERGGTINQKFSMYDVVVPMKYSKIGEEIPISRYQNGKRKEFYVVGIKLIYDGAVWQELTLQEKMQRV